MKRYLSHRVITIVVLITLFVIAFLLATNLQCVKTQDSTYSLRSFMCTETELDAGSLKYRTQRDSLSRQLNLMKQLYGQQNCQKLQLLKSSGEAKVDIRISETGGWCAKMSSPNSTFHKWDKGFSEALSNFLKGKTVASFGDGPGQYKKHIDSLGEVSSYIAYDGAPFCETVTDGIVKFLDLTAPQYGLPAYDWVVSVEVAEHIPAKYEDIYLDNLVRHAIEGIILSWAVPGQKGLSHVNEKAPEAVNALMEKRGFRKDQDAGLRLRQSSNFTWLRSNIKVYRREKVSFNPEDV